MPDPNCRTFEQDDRSLRITPLYMGDADRELREPLPELALLAWAALPRTLEDLVRGEGVPAVQRVLRPAQRNLRRKVQVVGYTVDPDAPDGEGTTETIAWAGISCPSIGVAIALPTT
ncbi:hypothetical protein AXK60_22480 [Tsukamurella pseudospumae]|uniref:Uncharacterized protein n=1 Tax=Tsukamurella pseudospumae TaxID=239498 RepID=A0A138AUG9_9ACTN|nr:hypothetical protein AXK61_18610 [Tsukamurella pseudospumae]KXP14026.1 hypothetical protein AXK60_22480 [Tsukamurella pseudospumae]